MKINITESEWKIMQVIWNEPYLTLGEIKKRLDKIITWDKTTINTLIRRLKNKKVVGAKEARYYQYYPLVSEEECLKNEIASILNRLFYSSPRKLMMTLINDKNFSKDDIEALEVMLEQIKGDQK